MVQIYVMNYNPKYQTESTAAFYDGDATFDDVVKDLEANQMEIRKVEFSKNGSMNTFVITVV